MYQKQASNCSKLTTIVGSCKLVLQMRQGLHNLHWHHFDVLFPTKKQLGLFFFFFFGGADSDSFFLSRRCGVNCQRFGSLAPPVGVRYDWAGGDRNILHSGCGCAGGGSRHSLQRQCRFGLSPIHYHRSEVVPLFCTSLYQPAVRRSFYQCYWKSSS